MTTQTSNQQQFSIRIARNLSDIMQIVSVRSATYIAEQNCPYGEEFDGNDLCGIQLIGSLDSEPVACLRLRFFADFAKIERLALRTQYRQSRIAFKMVQQGIELCRRKGYRKIYGHAQDRLVPFWSRFGAKPIARDCKLVFSDFGYTEMLLETEPHPDAITLDADPYVLVRPEGEWSKPGILDQSAVRGMTSPLHEKHAA